MRSTFSSLLAIQSVLFTTLCSFSQEPGWIDAANRATMFPASTWLTGFRSEPFSKGEDPAPVIDRLVKTAKTDLVEQIRVTISSTATFNLENLNTESLEHFRQASTSQSSASITGLKTETYVNRKKNEAYAMAWLNKKDLVASCKAGLKDKELRIAERIQLAGDLAASGNLEKALETYQECYPLLRDIENDIAILVSVGKEQVDEQTATWEGKVNSGISNIRQGRELSFDEVCYFLADGLNQQLPGGELDGPLMMGSFTYQDSKMGSSFAARLQATLEQKLTRSGFVTVSEETVRSALKEGGEAYQVAGTYWDEGNKVKIIANIRKINDGSAVSSMEEYITRAWLESNNISTLPENYQLASNRQREFTEARIIRDDLDVSLWTNGAGENPLFQDGDTMFVYMQVNKPCYIRLIYYLADGMKTLLADNFQIRPEHVNKPIRYPSPFICAEPFGSETLQVMAQTQPFQPLKTLKQNGYEIISQDVQGIMENYRGMKSTAVPLLKSEQRVNLTTVPR